MPIAVAGLLRCFFFRDRKWVCLTNFAKRHLFGMTRHPICSLVLCRPPPAASRAACLFYDAPLPKADATPRAGDAPGSASVAEAYDSSRLQEVWGRFVCMRLVHGSCKENSCRFLPSAPRFWQTLWPEAPCRKTQVHHALAVLPHSLSRCPSL